MLLGYIDESGIKYSFEKNGYFSDGPYAVWCCVLINEKKYFDIERGFQDLAKEYLGEDFQKEELHATDIWLKRKKNPAMDRKIRVYFEELVQFTAKLHVPIVVSVQQKNPELVEKPNTNKQAMELEKARYALLSVIESELANLNETAVLVADDEAEKKLLQNLVFERTKWRYSPPTKVFQGTVKPKFQFEYRSNSILDQLHYVNSNESLLMQYTDHLCYVLRKCLEHLYLLSYPQPNRPQADKTHLPISASTFDMFAKFSNIQLATFNEPQNDVMFTPMFGPLNTGFSFDAAPTLYVVGGSTPFNPQYLLGMFTPYH